MNWGSPGGSWAWFTLIPDGVNYPCSPAGLRPAGPGWIPEGGDRRASDGPPP